MSPLRLVALLALLAGALCQPKPAATSPEEEGHMHTAHGTSRTAALPAPASPCVKEPTGAACADFAYPQDNAVNDLHRLCEAMPFMGACSVASACSRAGAGTDSPGNAAGALKVSSRDADICRPFNQVATICRRDTGMARMAGCNNHNSMCVEGSKVEACRLAGITSIPTSKAMNTQLKAICKKSPKLEGCGECSVSWAKDKTWGDCDLLKAYSQVCASQPDMPQCLEFHSMCKADPSLVFCAGYNDAAQKAAAGVQASGTPGDKEAKPQAAPANAPKTSAAGAPAAGGLPTTAAAAAVALLLLLAL